MKLDLENDSAMIFGKYIKLKCTSSGHNCIPHEALINLNEESREQKVKVIDKLQKQFAHPSSSRLLSLLKDAGLFDEDVKTIVEEISKGCNVCKRYKKRLLDLSSVFR